jgi:hypothetical protein
MSWDGKDIFDTEMLREEDELPDIAYHDLGRLVGDELLSWLVRIAARRRVPFPAVVREAIQHFVEEDVLCPKGDDDDAKLSYPRGEGAAASEAKIARPSTKLTFPDPDDCPDHALESWLDLIKHDVTAINTQVQKDAAECPDVPGGGVALSSDVEYRAVLARYAAIEARLKRRLASRTK